MNNLIKKIISKKEIDQIFKYVLQHLYSEGPTSITTMEILSYLCLYCPETFSTYEDRILKFMGLFYKEIPPQTLSMAVFGMYQKEIMQKYNCPYTPVQASIVSGIEHNKCFSFSAPTSTGKSFVFIKLIVNTSKDVVIVVPSRALINEYYMKIHEAIPDKKVNILTFVDKINTKHSNRNIFIVTPERCAELFKHKEEFDIEYFMFDEAQLSNEDSKRGLFFDSIVRRSISAYPNAKYVFAHPFVKNPEAQIIKNHFDKDSSTAIQYQQKSVGQMFLYKEDEVFYHFGIEKEIMGLQRVPCEFDPIEKTICGGGSVLIYVSKASIYSKKIISEFQKYISICQPIKDKKAIKYISALQQYIGGSFASNKEVYSQMLDLMRCGIVIHHGSLPLQARIIIENFTKAGFCRICFATSTLEQGINMPFEVVYLHKFEASRQLALKNLIGRAGRSSSEKKFDFGYVIIRKNCLAAFRDIMTTDEIMKEVSSIEDVTEHDDDFNDFKEAIINGTISDEYNLTENELETLTSKDVQNVVAKILDAMFYNDKLLSLQEINLDTNCKLQLYSFFSELYADHLRRKLVPGEEAVLSTAIKIMLWRVYSKTFKEICWYRFAYASKLNIRRELLKKVQQSDGIQKLVAQAQLNSVDAAFCAEYHDLPNKDLQLYSMFSHNGIKTKAKNVDYDHIVFDTYDYIDKLLGFKLSDVFYAAFHKYFEATNDIRADKLAKYVKYGTDDNKKIWMLRYGLSFEDIEVLEKYVLKIDKEEMVLSRDVLNLPEDKIFSIQRFLPQE